MTEQSPQSGTALAMVGQESLSRISQVIEAKRQQIGPMQIEGGPTALDESLTRLLHKFESSVTDAEDLRKLEATDRQRQYLAEVTHESLMSSTNLPKRHKAMLVDADISGAWGEAQADVATRIGTGCLIALVGPRGTGKTQIGAFAVDRSCWLGRPAMYLEACAMFMQFRDCFRDGGDSEHATFKRFCTPRLLVIDQLEERKHSEHEDRALFNIINRRYNDESDTILISNETERDFIMSIGASIADRLAQTGEIIVCEWPSFRMRVPMTTTNSAGMNAFRGAESS